MQWVDSGGGCRGLQTITISPRACGGNRNPTNRPHNRSLPPRTVAGTVPPKRISGVRSVLGRRLGPQVAVSVGGAAGGEAGDGGRKEKEEEAQ